MDIGFYKDKYYCMNCGKIFDKIPNNCTCPKCLNNQFEKVDMNISNGYFVHIIKISSIEVLESIRDGCIWF